MRQFYKICNLKILVLKSFLSYGIKNQFLELIIKKENKMARKTLIAGNWKMNGLLADGVDLAKGVSAAVKAKGKWNCE